jgi:endopeptidase E
MNPFESRPQKTRIRRTQPVPIIPDDEGGSKDGSQVPRPDFQSIQGHVTNGVPSEVGQYPYYVHMATFVEGYWYSCGGTLIAPDIVLTAAHCNDPYSEENVEWAYVGATEFWSENNGAVEVRCADFKMNPDYIPGEYTDDWYLIEGTGVQGGADFALCKLETPVVIDTSQVYLDLNQDDDFPIGNTLAEATGMGVAGEVFECEDTEVLRDAEIPILDQSLCGWWYWRGVFDDMICTFSLDYINKRTGICNGDSGGPIVVPVPQDDGRTKHKQVGVVSWGAGYCGTNPDVHARVSKGMDWIKTAVCDEWGSDASFCDDNGDTEDDDTYPDPDDGLPVECVNNPDWYFGIDPLKNCGWIGWRSYSKCSIPGAAVNCPLYCSDKCSCVSNPGAPCLNLVARDTNTLCTGPLKGNCRQQCNASC